MAVAEYTLKGSAERPPLPPLEVESQIPDFMAASTPSPGSGQDDPLHPFGHRHYSHRSPWLRAAVLGANDGLTSVASLMVGVGAVNSDVKSMVISGLAALIGGALSMAAGEYVSVSSQKDSEKADLDKEREEHSKGPEHQLHEKMELARIYVERGLSHRLAWEVAEELSAGDVIKAHARDELGIDMEDLSNPWQAAFSSAIAFLIGGMLPLLSAAFIQDFLIRIIILLIATSFGFIAIGAFGAYLGGAPMWKASLRVAIGGWLAMGGTYGILTAFGSSYSSA